MSKQEILDLAAVETTETVTCIIKEALSPGKDLRFVSRSDKIIKEKGSSSRLSAGAAASGRRFGARCCHEQHGFLLEDRLDYG